jgi:hypothetical protein
MACALGLLAGRAAGRWGAACLLCHCAARRGTTRTSVHATSSMIRPATPTPRPIFFLPFHRVLRALRVLLLRASRALAVRGKRKSATVPCPCMIHLLLFLMKKSTSTPSSPLSLCHNFVRSDPAQRTVRACLPTLPLLLLLSLSPPFSLSCPCKEKTV